MIVRRFTNPSATAWVRAGWWGWCLLVALAAQAQLSITFPTARTVLQRNLSNQAQFTVAGICPPGTDQIDVQLTALNGGQTTGWFTLNAQPAQGHFAGQLTTSGGWYRLAVRALQGGSELATAQVEPIGVGEVFAIAGQSNGQGIRDRNAVDPADDRIVCVPHFNLNDTICLPLPAVSAPITATGVIGPRGLTSWCWGRLGDRLAQRLNVPVAFYNAAWSGTAVRNWRESITLDSTATSYNEYFRPGMPYGNLRRIVQDYARLTGLRAVLWHQGEAEFYDTDPSASNYFNDLQTVILQSRQDVDYPLWWVVARVSMDNNLYYNYGMTRYDPVVSRQNQVVQQVPYVYYGPDTDVIQMPRTDGVHFSDNGLIQVGDAWNDALTDDFFRSATPMLPGALQLTDLSARLQVDKAAVNLNQSVQLTIMVRNEGPQPATQVRVRCELPQPLVFVSGSGVTHKRGLVLATLPSVAANAMVPLTFTAQPTQPGNYRVATEIVRMLELDSDSRPNTSIGDGQDDWAQTSFRAGPPDSLRYQTAISVNAEPLPDLIGNQPPADADKADLSLKLAISHASAIVGQVVSVSLVISNRGGQPSGNVQGSCQLPARLTFYDSATMSQNGNVVQGWTDSIPPDGSAVLSFRAVVSAGSPNSRIQLPAQIESAPVTDPDSTPGNGFTNGEDDTATLGLRIK